MNHVHNTNKIIPKQRPRYALWTTHLDVYDPQDESTDCIGGFIGRLAEAMFPGDISAEDKLVCSPILGDVKPEREPELGREPEREPESEREPKRELESEPEPEHQMELEPESKSEPEREPTRVSQHEPEPEH